MTPPPVPTIRFPRLPKKQIERLQQVLTQYLNNHYKTIDCCTCYGKNEKDINYSNVANFDIALCLIFRLPKHEYTKEVIHHKYGTYYDMSPKNAVAIVLDWQLNRLFYKKPVSPNNLVSPPFLINP